MAVTTKTSREIPSYFTPVLEFQLLLVLIPDSHMHDLNGDRADVETLARR